MRLCLLILGFVLWANTASADLLTKAGAFNTGTGAATTTIDVTVGFQPKWVILLWSGRTETTDTVARADVSYGYGFVKDDADRGCIAYSYDDGNAEEVGRSGIRNDAALCSLDTSTGFDGLLDVSAVASWPSDGFQLVVDDQMPASFRVTYLAGGGADFTNVDIGTFNFQNALDVQITAPNFQPSVVFFLSNNLTSINSNSSTTRSTIIGVDIDSTQQALCGNAHTATAGQLSESRYYCLDGSEAFGTFHSTAVSPINRAAFDTMISQGFQYDQIEYTSAVAVVYLAIKGGSWAQGSVLTQTDTTTDITVTGLGHQPKGLLFLTAANVESTADTTTAPNNVGMGVATGASEEFAQSVYAQTNVDNMRSSTAVEHDAIYINQGALTSDSAPGSVEGLMDIQSIEANGFTLRMSDADPSSMFVWWVSVGTASSGGGCRGAFLLSGVGGC